MNAELVKLAIIEVRLVELRAELDVVNQQDTDMFGIRLLSASLSMRISGARGDRGRVPPSAPDMTLFADLTMQAENERIKTIAATLETRLTVGVYIDAHPPEKLERYLRKLRELVPNAAIEKKTQAGHGVWLVRFARITDA